MPDYCRPAAKAIKLTNVEQQIHRYVGVHGSGEGGQPRIAGTHKTVQMSIFRSHDEAEPKNAFQAAFALISVAGLAD